jgi:hypothetical protein
MPKRLSNNCKHCVDILVGFQIKHSEEDCPLRAALHCRYCCTYGHASDDCEDAPPDYVYKNNMSKALAEVDAARQPAAPPTKEKLPKKSSDPYYPALELIENERVLREFVRGRIGIPAMKIEENKRRIREWAKEAGVKIRYIEDKEAVDNFAEYDRIYDELNPKPAGRQQKKANT